MHVEDGTAATNFKCEKQYEKTNRALMYGYGGKRTSRNVKPNCEPRIEHGGDYQAVKAFGGIGGLLQRSCCNDRQTVHL
jgi:hypothetical protein